MFEYGYSSDPHPAFPQPENPDLSLWRYCDLSKLVSLLDTQKLHFARADSLNDPFEGYAVDLPRDWPTRGEIRKHVLGNVLTYGRNRMSAAISCWHASDHESAAMWKLYLSSSEGICIRSSFVRLTESLPRSSRDAVPIRVGQVVYGDLLQPPSEIDEVRVFMRKRKSFEHEREVRALVYKPGPMGVFERWNDDFMEFYLAAMAKDENERRRRRTARFYGLVEYIGRMRESSTRKAWLPPSGLAVPVDVTKLVERIYVSPTSPAWFADVVRAVVRRFGFGFEVHQSQLGASREWR